MLGIIHVFLPLLIESISMRFPLLLLISVFISSTHIYSESALPKHPKVLMLIIASEDAPVYTELKKLWRQYMQSNPEQVEAYFICGDPALPVECVIEGDTIWSKTAESIIPGILNKTILSLEAFLPRIQTEFDYVLRTNLSSFYIFPRLLQFLETCPRDNFYCGRTDYERTFCSGSGFILSPDLATMLVTNKSYLLNANTHDDVSIGAFFKDRGIKPAPHARIDFCSFYDWFNQKDCIPSNIFQCRIKNSDETRLKDDIFMYKELQAMFYPHIEE